jgi:hypothetical protein
VLPSCGGTINYPKPSLISISPSSVLTSQTNPFMLTVIGNNFVQQSAVEWNGTTIFTLFVNSNQMTATVPPSFYQVPGTATITVVTPQPGGGTTTGFTFTVNPTAGPVPHINSLSPSGALAGSGGLVLNVSGTNFVPQSTVTVNGSNRTTEYSNSTAVAAALTAADLMTPGVLQVTVVNPVVTPPGGLPGGGASNSVPLSINAPLPVISAVSPTGALAGAVATSLSVTGTGFISQYSYISINGVPQTTTFVSATQVSAPLTAAQLSVSGVNQVTVINPGPGGGTSNIFTFAVNPTAALGLPEILDLAPDGSQANSGICGGLPSCTSGAQGLTLATVGPSTSNTGQYVAYASVSNNLVTGESIIASSIFLRNTCIGVASCIPATFVVSNDPDGNPANGASSEPSIDSGGTAAAYTSLATNLVTTVTVPSGTSQVYRQIPCTATAGCSSSTTNEAELISISADAATAGNGKSYNPAISPDGRYIAFISLATNLDSNVSLDGVTPQVFLADTCSGVTGTTCTPTVVLISTPDGTTPANSASSNPSISEDGLYVSFTSTATNLGATAPNPNGVSEVFETTTCANITGVCKPTTYLISTPDGVTPSDGASGQSSVSSTGRFVAFASTGTNLITGVGPTQEIYVRDTCIAEGTVGCTPSTTLVSTLDGTTPGNGLSEHPSISSTGQYTAFATLSSNFAATTNGVENIFVRNTCATITTTCTTALALSSFAAGTSGTLSNGSSLDPSISPDGTVVSFLSFSSNLVARDNNGLEDIFLGTTTFALPTD